MFFLKRKVAYFIKDRDKAYEKVAWKYTNIRRSSHAHHSRQINREPTQLLWEMMTTKRAWAPLNICQICRPALPPCMQGRKKIYPSVQTTAFSHSDQAAAWTRSGLLHRVHGSNAQVEEKSHSKNMQSYARTGGYVINQSETLFYEV